MKKPLTIADLVMAIGGLVTFIFSFLDFYKSGDFGESAWSGDLFAFATAVPALLALAMVVWIALDLFGVALPTDVLTFTHAQLKATWGISAAGIMLSWLTVSPYGVGDEIDKGVGFWLMLLGSLAMAAGAVMALLGKGTETVVALTAPAPSGGAAPAAPAPPAADVPPPAAPPPPPPPPPPAE